jgi:hypothetical protein
MMIATGARGLCFGAGQRLPGLNRQERARGNGHRQAYRRALSNMARAVRVEIALAPGLTRPIETAELRTLMRLAQRRLARDVGFRRLAGPCFGWTCRRIGRDRLRRGVLVLGWRVTRNLRRIARGQTPQFTHQMAADEAAAARSLTLIGGHAAPCTMRARAKTFVPVDRAAT